MSIEQYEMELNYLTAKYHAKLNKMAYQGPILLGIPKEEYFRILDDTREKAHTLFYIFADLYEAPTIPDLDLELTKLEMMSALIRIHDDVIREKKKGYKPNSYDPTPQEISKDPYYIRPYEGTVNGPMYLKESIMHFRDSIREGKIGCV